MGTLWQTISEPFRGFWDAHGLADGETAISATANE